MNEKYEKLMTGLQCCIEGARCYSDQCPYFNDAPNIQGCTRALCEDALDLLQAVMPKRGGYMERMWECGSCGTPLGIVGDDVLSKYCRECGKKVLWESYTESKCQQRK